MGDKKTAKLIVYSVLAGALCGSLVTYKFMDKKSEKLKRDASLLASFIQAVFTGHDKERYYRKIREQADKIGIRNYVEDYVIGTIDNYFLRMKEDPNEKLRRRLIYPYEHLK